MKAIAYNSRTNNRGIGYVLYLSFTFALVFHLYASSLIAQEGVGRKAISDSISFSAPVGPVWAFALLIIPINLTFVLLAIASEFYDNKKRKCLSGLTWCIYILLCIAAVLFFINTPEKFSDNIFPSWYRLMPLIITGIPAGILYSRTSHDELPVIFIVGGIAYAIIFFYIAGSNVCNF